MVTRYPLKGVHKVTAKGRDYYYAWKGPPLGPRLRGDPGSPEFHASYVEAHETLRAPDTDRFRSLIVAYKASADFGKLAPSTKKAWSPWLDRIADHFGDLRIAQFDRPHKIKPVIIEWRNQFAGTPRKADFALAVLSRVLSHATNVLGKLSGNPCEGIQHLYSGGDRSEIIWTSADLAKLKETCSPEIAHAADLAACSGLRLGDLVRLSWSHIGEDEIVIATNKSGGKRAARVPLYDDLRVVLAAIPRRATTVLTHGMGRPWAAKSLGNAFTKAKNAAGFADLHFHDLRGTAATKFYLAGLPEHLIAEVMGWEPEHVAKIIRKYVDRSAIIRAAIVQINEAKERMVSKSSKTDPKPKGQAYDD
jgi:integrase